MYNNYSDNFKSALNKIDFELKNLFENVKFIEKTNTKLPSFTFIAESSKMNKCINMIINVEQIGIIGNSITWKYKTNPLNENSMEITRLSTFNTFMEDVYTIIKENRFEKEYINYINEQLIKENKENVIEEPIMDEIEEDTYLFKMDSIVEDINNSEIFGKVIKRYAIIENNKPSNMYTIRMGFDDDKNINERYLTLKK